MTAHVSEENWLVLLESVTDDLACDYESCDRPGAGIVIWKQRHDCGCGQAEIVCASHANEIVMALTFNLGLRCGRTLKPVGRAREWIRDVEPL